MTQMSQRGQGNEQSFLETFFDVQKEQSKYVNYGKRPLGAYLRCRFEKGIPFVVLFVLFFLGPLVVGWGYRSFMSVSNFKIGHV